MAAKKAERAQHTQAERLKTLLNSMDKALEKALDGLTIGIMTDPVIRVST